MSWSPKAQRVKSWKSGASRKCTFSFLSHILVCHVGEVSERLWTSPTRQTRQDMGHEIEKELRAFYLHMQQLLVSELGKCLGAHRRRSFSAFVRRPPLLPLSLTKVTPSPLQPSQLLAPQLPCSHLLQTDWSPETLKLLVWGCHVLYQTFSLTVRV